MRKQKISIYISYDVDVTAWETAFTPVDPNEYPSQTCTDVAEPTKSQYPLVDQYPSPGQDPSPDEKSPPTAQYDQQQAVSLHVDSS